MMVALKRRPIIGVPRSTLPGGLPCTARIALSDVFICGGICTVYEATVTIVGTGDADVFEVSDVRVDGYSMRDYPHPIGKILFDEIAGKITIDQAEAALLENYDAD